ncbi:hypothetical protein GCM10010346_18480 [Streptomyces chryseus]|uniref:Uncharacterized protein n=1 Tax=Streptomyces chryseus TaxID=68186 RepID=A0ABQ3DHJ7_9ACTN|nr:hypothetical protein GCM10010346_18480 [Streptomyces chryseus]
MDHSHDPCSTRWPRTTLRSRLLSPRPATRQGRGTDPRVRAVLGDAVFRSDVLATSGLDDRTSSRGVLAKAQELMADAVGAEHTFFST